MGKITGFLEIERQEPSYEPAADRVLVMSRRPGRIIEEIAIDLPDRDNPLARRRRPEINDTLNRLMERLDIGQPSDVPEQVGT
jgi:hypothetical protein